MTFKRKLRNSLLLLDSSTTSNDDSSPKRARSQLVNQNKIIKKRENKSNEARTSPGQLSTSSSTNSEINVHGQLSTLTPPPSVLQETLSAPNTAPIVEQQSNGVCIDAFGNCLNPNVSFLANVRQRRYLIF